jgi:hypothetical protein
MQLCYPMLVNTLNLNSHLNLDPFQILEIFMSRQHLPFFMEILTIPTLQSGIELFKINFAMVIHRAKAKNVQAMTAWLGSFYT